MRLLISSLVMAFIVVGCGKKSTPRPRSVGGWWQAIEVVQDGERNLVDPSASVIIGFNSSFQMYALDGSDPACSGKNHGYEIKSSGEIEVQSYFDAHEINYCQTKSAKVKVVEDQKLVLSDVRFSEKLVFNEVVFQSISFAKVTELYPLATRTTKTNSSNPQHAPRVVNREVSGTVTAPPVQEVKLEGVYVSDHYILDGTRYEIGQQISVGDKKGNLPKQQSILHFRKGEFMSFIDGRAIGPKYVAYHIKGGELSAAQGGYVDQRLKMIETGDRQIRVRGLLVLPIFSEQDIVMVKVSKEKADELLKNSPLYKSE